MYNSFQCAFSFTSTHIPPEFHSFQGEKPLKQHSHNNETQKFLKPQTNEIFRWGGRMIQHTYSILGEV